MSSTIVDLIERTKKARHEVKVLLALIDHEELSPRLIVCKNTLDLVIDTLNEYKR